MLVLSRKLNEEVIIGDNIRITVVAIRGNQVRLGFTAPPDVAIQRQELREEDRTGVRPNRVARSAARPHLFACAAAHRQ